MFCSRCGQPLEESDLFCSKCGQKIEEFAQEKVQDKPQQEESLPKKISSADPDASSTNESASPAYPYYHAMTVSRSAQKEKPMGNPGSDCCGSIGAGNFYCWRNFCFIR